MTALKNKLYVYLYKNTYMMINYMQFEGRTKCSAKYAKFSANDETRHCTFVYFRKNVSFSQLLSRIFFTYLHNYRTWKCAFHTLKDMAQNALRDVPLTNVYKEMSAYT